MFRSVARPFVTSLALVLLIGTQADAGSAPVFHASLHGRTATLQTDGTLRTGAWRVTVTDASGRHRLVVMVARGDIDPVAALRFLVRTDGHWHAVRTVPLARAIEGGKPVSACFFAMHACFDSRGVTPPGGSAQDLRVRVRLTRPGVFAVSGGTRRSREAFVLEPWRQSPQILLDVD